jgi:hypothetical protein
LIQEQLTPLEKRIVTDYEAGRHWGDNWSEQAKFRKMTMEQLGEYLASQSDDFNRGAQDAKRAAVQKMPPHVQKLVQAVANLTPKQYLAMKLEAGA